MKFLPVLCAAALAASAFAEDMVEFTLYPNTGTAVDNALTNESTSAYIPHTGPKTVTVQVGKPMSWVIDLQSTTLPRYLEDSYSNFDDPLFAAPGMRFAGWFTEPTGGVQVLSTDIVTNGGPYSLYAHWTNAYVKCTFDAMGGIAQPAETNVMYTFQFRQALSSVGAWKQDCLFAGWYTNSMYLGNVMSNKTYVTFDHDFTLYAKWETNFSGTVTLDLNGSDFPVTRFGSDGRVGRNYGNTNTGPWTPLPMPRLDGGTFVRWAQAKNNSGPDVYSSSAVGTNKTIYAIWEVPVTFDGAGGTLSFTNAVYTNGLSYATMPTATRPHYVLKGYATAPEDLNTVVTNTDTVAAPVVASSQGIRLTAVWEYDEPLGTSDRRVLWTDQNGDVNAPAVLAKQADLAGIAASNQYNAAELRAAKDGYDQAIALLGDAAASLASGAPTVYCSLELVSFQAAAIFDVNTDHIRIVRFDRTNETADKTLSSGVTTNCTKCVLSFCFFSDLGGTVDLAGTRPITQFVRVLDSAPTTPWTPLDENLATVPVVANEPVTVDGTEYSSYYTMDLWFPTSDVAGFFKVEVPVSAATGTGNVMDTPGDAGGWNGELVFGEHRLQVVNGRIMAPTGGD